MPHHRVYENNEMQLPEDILSAFAAFRNLGCTVYLNAFHAGLMSTDAITNPRKGLRFVCTHVDEPKLLQAGFIKSIADARVFTKIHEGKTLTLHNLPLRENWMLHFAQETEAFRCAALYIDRVGRFFDPTHQAINDLIDGKLFPLHDPIALFENDPSALFVALEHLMNGYTPTNALKIAIQFWHPESTQIQECQSHIYHYLIKQTNEAKVAAYIEQLQAFDLTEKLFNMLFITDTAQLVSTLLQRLQIPRHPIQLDVISAEQRMKSLSQLAQDQPRLAAWVNAAKNSLRESRALEALDLAAAAHMAPK